MLTIPQVQALLVEAAQSSDAQVKALAAVGGALMIIAGKTRRSS
jgi:hypothetical protein